jgi:hypothetical protein
MRSLYKYVIGTSTAKQCLITARKNASTMISDHNREQRMEQPAIEMLAALRARLNTLHAEQRRVAIQLCGLPQGSTLSSGEARGGALKTAQAEILAEGKALREMTHAGQVKGNMLREQLAMACRNVSALQRAMDPAYRCAQAFQETIEGSIHLLQKNERDVSSELSAAHLELSQADFDYGRLSASELDGLVRTSSHELSLVSQNVRARLAALRKESRASWTLEQYEREQDGGGLAKHPQSDIDAPIAELSAENNRLAAVLDRRTVAVAELEQLFSVAKEKRQWLQTKVQEVARELPENRVLGAIRPGPASAPDVDTLDLQQGEGVRELEKRLKAYVATFQQRMVAKVRTLREEIAKQQTMKHDGFIEGLARGLREEQARQEAALEELRTGFAEKRRLELEERAKFVSERAAQWAERIAEQRTALEALDTDLETSKATLVGLRKQKLEVDEKSKRLRRLRREMKDGWRAGRIGSKQLCQLLLRAQGMQGVEAWTPRMAQKIHDKIKALRRGAGLRPPPPLADELAMLAGSVSPTRGAQHREKMAAVKSRYMGAHENWTRSHRHVKLHAYVSPQEEHASLSGLKKRPVFHA